MNFGRSMKQQRKNIKKDYDPRYSDGIKFSKNLNQPYFESHNKEFLTLWKQLVIKHFDISQTAQRYIEEYKKVLRQ